MSADAGRARSLTTTGGSHGKRIELDRNLSGAE